MHGVGAHDGRADGAQPEVLVDLGADGVVRAAAPALFLGPIRTEITLRLPKPLLDALRIESCVLGADAAAIGAARLISTARP